MTDFVDWSRIASRLQDAMRRMTHEENWTGPDFYAEALRRAFGYQPQDGHGRDHVQHGNGLITESYAKHLYDNGALERMQREQAEEQVKDMRAEVRRVYAEAGKDFAEFLRERCNERSVPSRYRREGVAWAADMIDPSVPKDQYGSLRESAAAESSSR
jgi:ribosomal protein S19E (S16A)